MSVSTDVLMDKVDASGEGTSTGEAALQEAGQTMDSTLYSDLPLIPGIQVGRGNFSCTVDCH